MRKLPVIIMVLMVAAASLAALALDHAGVQDELAADPVDVQVGTWADLQEQIDSAQGSIRITLRGDIEGPGDACLVIDNKRVEIDLNGHVIDGKRTGPDNRGGVIRINYGSAVTISDSGTGGAITGGKAARGGAIFAEDNTTVTLKGVALRDNEATAEGGAIFISGEGQSISTFTLTDCWIDRNTATGNGGGIANYGKLTINGNTLVVHNESRKSGGGIYTTGTVNLDGGAVSNNVAANDGGGVCNYGGKFYFRYGNMVENKAVSGNGGGMYAIQANNGGWLELSGASVTGNSASGNGGGIWAGIDIVASGSVTVKDNSCSSNYGNNLLLVDRELTVTGKISDSSRIDFNKGGNLARMTWHVLDTGTSSSVFSCNEDPEHFAFNGTDFWHITDVKHFDVQNGDEEDLRDMMNDGAKGGLRKVILDGDGATVYTKKKILVEDGRNVILDTNGNIISRENDGNKETNGHVVEIDDETTFTLMDSKYGVGNYKGGIYDGNAKRGGGFNIHGDSTLIVLSGYIADNRAGDGGAIYCYGKLLMLGGTITNNEATDTAGAIYLDDGATGDIRNVRFENNWAEEAGAIIFQSSGKISDCHFNNHKSTKNHAGTIYIDHGSKVEIVNTIIKYGEAEKCGGGVYLEEGTLTMTGSTVQSCKSYHEGGAGIMVREDCKAEFRDCNISFNTITANDTDNAYSGGGIYVEEDASITVWDSVIEFNDSLEFGGGIYTEGNVTLTRTNLEGNLAYRSGGGIYAKDCKVEMTDIQMNGCTAQIRNGGGFYLDEDASAKINGITMNKCRCLEYGGAICVSEESSGIEIQGNINIQGNYASNGPGIYLWSGQVLRLSGSLASGSVIQVDIEGTKGIFTKNYSAYHSVEPSEFFLTIVPLKAKLKNGEASIELDTGYENANYFIPKKDHIFADRTKIDSRNWMAGISGERKLNEINLMGTNESATKDLNDEFCDNIQFFRTYTYVHQDYTIPEQMNMGIRMLEVCLTNEYMKWGLFKDKSVDDGENLWLIEYTFDGLFYCEDPDGKDLSLKKTLDWIKDFLMDHPTETILVEVKFNHKGDFDTTMNRLGTILTSLANEINPSTGDKFLYFENAENPLERYDEYPKLRDCRGKVVIMAADDIADRIGGMDVKTLGSQELPPVQPGSIWSHPLEYIVKHLTVYDAYTVGEFYLKHYGLQIPKTAEHHPAEKDFAYVVHTNVDHDPFWDPLEAAEHVNIMFLPDALFVLPGIYTGMLWVDGVQPDIAFAAWDSNYMVGTHCSITVYPGTAGFDVQNYALLKQTEITLPGNIYDGISNFKGWQVADKNGVRMMYEGNPYTIVGDVTFTAVWETSDQIPLQIIWMDGSDADGIRPDQIEVQFISSTQEPRSWFATAENGWRFTFAKDTTITSVKPVWEGHVSDTPVSEGWHGTDADGMYQYACAGNNDNGYSITMRHSPTVTVYVTWPGVDEGDRPNSVTVYLLDGGYVAGSGTATAASGWKCGIQAQASSKESEVQYTATIAPVPGFTVSSIGTAIMVLKSESVNNVLILWDDGRNVGSHRPTKTTLNYSDKTMDVYSPEALLSWTYAHIDYDGEASGLTVSPVEGYTTTVEKVGSVYVIKNSWTAETVDYTIRWTDEDSNPGGRPDNVQLTFMPGNKFTVPTGSSITLTYKNKNGDTILPANLNSQGPGLYIVQATGTGQYAGLNLSYVFQVTSKTEDPEIYQVSLPGWTQSGYDSGVNKLLITYEDGMTAYKHPDKASAEVVYKSLDTGNTVQGPSNSLEPGMYSVTVSYPATESCHAMSATTVFQVKPSLGTGDSFEYAVQMTGWVSGQYDGARNVAKAVGTDGNPFAHPGGAAAAITYWKWDGTGALVQMQPGDLQALAPGVYLAQIHYDATTGEHACPAMTATTLFQVTTDYGARIAFELHMPSWVSGSYSESVNKPYLTGSDGSSVYYHPAGLSPTYTYATLGGSPVTPSGSLPAGLYTVTASFDAAGIYPAMTATTIFEVRASAAADSLAFEICTAGWRAGDFSAAYDAAKLIGTDSITYSIPRAEVGTYDQSGKLDVTGYEPGANARMSLFVRDAPGYNASVVRSGNLFQIQLSPATTTGNAESLIGAIGTVEYTAESEGRINAAKEAYMNIPMEQRSSVTNKDVLISAIRQFNILANDYSKVHSVEQSIIKAYEDNGIFSQALVQLARAAYDVLEDNLKPQVSNYYLLQKMEHDLNPSSHADFDQYMVFQSNVYSWEEGTFNQGVNRAYLTVLGGEAVYHHPDGDQPTYRYLRWDGAEVELSNNLAAGRYYVVASFDATDNHPAASALGTFIVQKRSSVLDCHIEMKGWRVGCYSDESPSIKDRSGRAYAHPDGIEPTFTYLKPDGDEIPADALKDLDVGTYTVKATYQATQNYPLVTITASFRVTSVADANLAFELHMSGWEYGLYDEDGGANDPYLTEKDGRTTYVHPASLVPTYTYRTSDGIDIVTPSDELPVGVYRVTATFTAVRDAYPAMSVTALFEVKNSMADADRTFQVMMPGWVSGSYSESVNKAKAICADGSDFVRTGTPTVTYYMLGDPATVIQESQLGPLAKGVYKAEISYTADGSWPAMTASTLFEVTSKATDLQELVVVMPGWTVNNYDSSFNSPKVNYSNGGRFTHPAGAVPDITYTNLDGTPITTALSNLPSGTYVVTVTYPALGQFLGATVTTEFNVSERGALQFRVDMKGWEYGGYNEQLATAVHMDGVTPFVHPAGAACTIQYIGEDLHYYTEEDLPELMPGLYAAFITYEAKDGYPQSVARKPFTVSDPSPSDFMVCKVYMQGWEVGNYHGLPPQVKDQNGKPFVHPYGVTPIFVYGDMDGNLIEVSNDLPVGNYAVSVIYTGSVDYPSVSDLCYFRVYEQGDEPTLIDPNTIKASFDSNRYDGERKTVNVTVGNLVRDRDFKVRVMQEGMTAIPKDSDYYEIMVVLSNMDYMFEVNGKAEPCYTVSLTIGRGINEITDLKLRGWTVGDEPNKPTATALFGEDEAVFTYSDSETGTFVPEVPTEVGEWFVKASIRGNDNYTSATETASFVISPEPGPPVDPTIVIVNPDGSITRERIDTKIDPDGTKTVTVDAVTTYPDGKYVESYSVTVSKDGESTMTETSKIKSADGVWSLEATIETERPFGPDITTTVTSDDGVGYAVSEALISGVQGWFVGGEEVKMALEQSQATVDLLGIAGPVQWRIGLYTGSVVAANITSDSMAEIADKDANFVIRSDEGAVVYDNTALDTLASLKKDVEFEMRVDDPSTINRVQEMAIGDGHYVFVSTTVDDRYVSDLGGGTLSITIPFDEEVGEGYEVKAFYVDRDGHLEEVESRYSADSKTVTIITGHHSIYTLQVTEKPLIVLEYGDLTKVVTAAIAVAALLYAVFMIRTKRVRGSPSSGLRFPVLFGCHLQMQWASQQDGASQIVIK